MKIGFRIPALMLLTVLIHSVALRADIFRWDNGEPIPGTEGITPGPGVQLGRRDLEYADLRDRNLSGATFFGSTLTNADLTAALVDSANFSSTTSLGFTKEQLYATASYQGKNLKGIYLESNDLSGWDLSERDLTGASFDGSSLLNANLRRSDLTGASFWANWDDFQNSDLRQADFSEAIIEGATLIEATLRGGFTKEQLYSTASYGRRQLPDLDMANNDLAAWDLAGQNVSRSSFIGSDLTGVDFTNANLTDTDLIGSDLSGTDLSGANLKNACLDRATASVAPIVNDATVYNQWTIFPEWLDPDAAGLTFVESAAGDFDANDTLDAADFDRFLPRFNRSVVAQTKCHSYHPPMFNLNGDRVVDQLDHQVWVHDIMGTWFGDANLDGEFNSSDLVQVFTAGAYEEDTSSASGWATGDWNADGEFTSGDLVVAFTDGGYEQGPRPAAKAVPEPTGIGMMTVGLMIVGVSSTRRRGRG